jgi:hypothetical protein
VKAKVAQPKIERGWKGVPNKAELEQKIKAENPKNVPPPTRAAAREEGSPAPALGTSPAGADRGPAGSPGPRGNAGRVVPGATQAPSLGGSPLPVERGKGRPGARPRPGATAKPEEGAGRVSPSPFEDGRPGGRARPGVTAGPREGLSPSPFERGGARARQGARSPEPGPAGAARATPRSAFEGAPSQQPQHGRQPSRRPADEQNPAHGGEGQTPPQGNQGGLERQRFGTPAPLGAAEHQQRGTGAPSGFRQPVTPPPGGGATGEARGQRERMQSANGQPPPPQQRQQPQQRPQGGAPAPANQGQAHGQPEGGKQKAEKPTPVPRP